MHLRAAFQYLNGGYKKADGDFVQGHVVMGQRGMALN